MLKSSLSLALLLTFVSCNGGGGGGGGSAPAPVVEAANFSGYYVGCESDGAENTSEITTYTVSDNSLIVNVIFFSGINCQTGNSQYEERYVHDFTSRAGDVFKTNLVGASTRSLSNADVNYNNTNTYCGISGWTINVPQNILNKNCGGSLQPWGYDSEITFVKNGNALAATAEGKTVNLTLAHAPNFADNTTPSNGKYVFYTGNMAYFLTLSGGAYSLDIHNIDTQKKYNQVGSYNVLNNDLNLIMSAETPTCGGYNFGAVQVSSGALSIIFKDDTEIITAENIDWTSTQFVNSFAGLAPPVTGCI